MKTKILISAAFLVLIGMASCNKKGCTDPAATNYDSKAKKDDGSCILPPPDPRAQYLDSYQVVDSLYMFGNFSERQVYTLLVTTGGTASDTIYLNNLWNGGSNFMALMAGSSFSIPSQQVSGPYYATGNGNFSGNTITYQTSGDVYVNEGEGTKQ